MAGVDTAAKVVRQNGGGVWRVGGAATLFIFAVAIRSSRRTKKRKERKKRKEKTQDEGLLDKGGGRGISRQSDKLACHAASWQSVGNIFIERLAVNGNPGVSPATLFSSRPYFISLTAHGNRPVVDPFPSPFFVLLFVPFSPRSTESALIQQIQAWTLPDNGVIVNRNSFHYLRYTARRVTSGHRAWIYRCLNALFERTRHDVPR